MGVSRNGSEESSGIIWRIGSAYLSVAAWFDRLLKADDDEQAEDDGGDVDEEVAPGVGGMMGRVDVKHGRAPAWLGVTDRGPGEDRQ